MSVSMVSSFLGAVAATGAVTATRQNSPPTSSVQSDLQQIREKGMTAWAHDKKMEELKQRIRDELMAQRGLTKDGVEAMPEADRTTVENEIAKLVEERLQKTLETAAEESAKDGKTDGLFLNIMV